MSLATHLSELVMVFSYNVVGKVRLSLENGRKNVFGFNYLNEYELYGTGSYRSIE